MYFIDAIQYPFQSEGYWGKLVTLILLGIGMAIPIVNIFVAFILSGYAIRIIRSVGNGERNLPEFDFGGDLSSGFTVFLGILVYMIPAILLSGVISLVANAIANGNMNNIIFLLLMLISILISFLWGLSATVAIIRYSESKQFNVFLEYQKNIQIALSNPGAFIAYFINTLLLGIVMGILISIGFVLLIIPGLIMSVSTFFMNAYVMARYGKDANLF